MRLRDESGISLVELMTSMVLSLIVLGAALSIGTSAVRHRESTERHNDAQQQARTGLERIARQLRNLASPTDLVDPTKNKPMSVERNDRYDLVFRTVEDVNGSTAANPTGVKRVRYCLDSTTPEKGVLWRQEQTPDQVAASPTPPPPSSCPGPQWNSERVVAQNVVNRINGQDRPLWVFAADGRLLTYNRPEDLPDATRIEARLWIDPTPNTLESETPLSTSILLRNQNREPVALFSSSLSGRTVQLNGSASNDPENEQLTYEWFEGDTKIGDGLVFSVSYAAAGSHTYTLRVTDQAGLQGVSQPQTVVVS